MNKIKITFGRGILTLITVLVVLLASFIIIYFYKTNILVTYRITKEKIDVAQTNIAIDISSNLNAIEMYVAMLARLDSNHNIMTEKQLQSKVMWSQVMSNENIDGMFIADKNRNFLRVARYPSFVVMEMRDYKGTRTQFIDYKRKDYSTEKTEVSKTEYDPTSRDWYKLPTKSDTFHWSEPYVYQDGQKGITVSYAVIEGGDKIKVAAADFTSIRLSSMLNKYAKSLKGDLVLYNSKGVIISSSFLGNKADKISDLKESPQIINLFPMVINSNMLNGEVSDGNNEDYIYFTQSLDSTVHKDWYLTTCVKKSTIYQSIYDSVLKVVVISLIVIALMYLVMLYILKRVVIRPVIELKQLSNNISNKDFDKITPVNTNFYEFDDLAQSMLDMSQAIKNYQDHLELLVEERTIDLEKAKQEVEELHKHTQESIEYASLIQHSLIPSNDLFRKYFSDYLTIWHPKDIVGGDIYLFEELRNDDECLLMLVDCTGHGVPGAFVTMLVKAIERQIVANILYSDEIVSPAKILGIFNRSMKHLLKQETDDSISNAGFDGAVLYFNKEQQILKYAGANTPLFYTQNKELITIKGDKHSIGYKKSDMKFEFKEHIIPTQKGMEFFITTDGYLDQNGGEKGFPFGTKKFKNIIEEYAEESMADKQEVFLDRMQDHRGHEEQNDDITIIGIQI